MNIQFPEGSGISGLVYKMVSGILSWGWVGYGFAIVFFTLFIKLMLAPLDFCNRYLSRRTQIKQQALADEVADLQQTYGNDPMLFARARQELYRKNGVNGGLGALVSLISLIVTMVIFFNVLGALNNISKYNIYTQYQALQTEYRTYLAGKDVANLSETEQAELRTKLTQKYEDTKVSFGWIKNIWQPDNFWSASVMSVDEYNKSQPSDRQLHDDAAAEYAKIYEYIDVKDHSNGFLILALLAGITSFVAAKISAIMTKRNAPAKKEIKKAEPIITYSMRDARNQATQKDQPAVDPAQVGKIMQWVMPIIFVVFAFSQTSAFAIYMIASSLVSTGLNLLFGWLVNLLLRNLKNKPLPGKDFDANIINPHAKYFKGGKK